MNLHFSPTTQVEFDSAISQCSDLSDIITLPDEVLNWTLNINNVCTILGNTNTQFNYSGLSIINPISISADVDISGLQILNDNLPNYIGIEVSNCSPTLSRITAIGDIGFKFTNVSNGEFEDLAAGSSNIGFSLTDTYNNNWTNINTNTCSLIGIDLIGTSTIVGDTFSYQELGLNVVATDPSGLTATTQYYFTINSVEYLLETGSDITYMGLVNDLNSLTGFRSDFYVTYINNDIRISKLSSGSVDITTGTTGTDLLSSIVGFITVEAQVSGEEEETRTDRTHHNIFNGLLSYSNAIGVRLLNADNNTFDSSRIFENTNIGIWQQQVSYNNIYRGEIYGNVNYGIRNMDKKHVFDAMSVWWGSLNGPSGGGRGEGDKISNYILFEPWLQSGTEPDLSYPITRDFIWTMLGAPLVRVELTEEQITSCIDTAIKRWMRYMMWETNWAYIDASSGMYELALPATDDYPDGIPKEAVIEVVYQPYADLFAQLTGSESSFFLTYYMQNSGGTFLADFYIAMGYKETFENTLGLTPSYEFIGKLLPGGESEDRIRIYPRPSEGMKVGIRYSRVLTEEEVDSHLWIRRYALAWAKEVLGRIRSKFGSVPGPTGEMQLDGQQLLSESATEREALDAEILLRSEPLSFTTG